MQDLFRTDDMILHLNTTNNLLAAEMLAKSIYAKQLQESEAHGILLRLSKKEVPQLVAWLVQQQIEVLSVEPRFTLEDYFLKITTANQHVEPFTH